MHKLSTRITLHYLHNLEENKHRIKPYENVIDTTALCSSLLPDQDYFEAAQHLQPNSSTKLKGISICHTPFCDWGKRQDDFEFDIMKLRDCKWHLGIMSNKWKS